jgi:hypothetical protein
MRPVSVRSPARGCSHAGEGADAPGAIGADPRRLAQLASEDRSPKSPGARSSRMRRAPLHRSPFGAASARHIIAWRCCLRIRSRHPVRRSEPTGRGGFIGDSALMAERQRFRACHAQRTSVPSSCPACCVRTRGSGFVTIGERLRQIRLPLHILLVGHGRLSCRDGRRHRADRATPGQGPRRRLVFMRSHRARQGQCRAQGTERA